MYKNGTTTSLTFKGKKPKPCGNSHIDYERTLEYNASFHHSQNTAMNIKHRILELNRLGADPRQILNDILKEINLELMQ